jgi:exopolysaccharide production protein ExoQ
MIQQRITDGILPLLPILVLVASKALSPLLAIVAVLAAWQFRAHVNRGLWNALKPERMILFTTLALLGWGALSALWSVEPAESLSSLSRVASAMVAGIWLCYAINHMPPIRWGTLRVLAIILGIVLAILMLEGYSPIHLIELWMQVKGGDYHTYIESHINRGLCALAVLVWPIVLGLHRNGYIWLARALPVVMIVALSAPLYESAAALMGLAAGLTLWGVLAIAPRLARIMPIVIAGLFLVMPLLMQSFLHGPYMNERIAKLSSNRTTVWISMFEHGMDNPIIGRGMNMSYTIPMEQALMDRLQLQGPPMHPHNFSFQALLELGIIGLVLMSAFVYAVFQRLAKIPDRVLQHSALVTASVFLVTGIISFNVWQNWWIACGWFALICWKRLATARA